MLRQWGCWLAMAVIVGQGTIVRAEPLLVTVGADAVLPLPSRAAGSGDPQPQLALFKPGASASIGLLLPLGRVVLLGARLRGGVLLDGAAPDDPGREDPGLGTFHSLSGLIRLRPLPPTSPSRGTGLFVDLGGGATLTGRLARPSLEAALGYGIPAGHLNLAPVARYVQIVHLSSESFLDHRDARLLMLGLELSFPDRRQAPVAPLPPAPQDLDRDGDGIPDARDACPDDPEDMDGFEDADGCPDPDNDRDGILDAQDACPNEAEDTDGFEDADGCPDPDNDRDGILDAEDACPNEPETINGNADDDGCPDAGLFQMIDDRIVLEERVLFDFERARVRHRARPILEAIVQLQAQHPEWVRIRIEGHADVRGDADFNLTLSQRRAENVRRELIQLGIPEQIIVSEGFGATRLRDAGDEEEAHQRNRRVEFVVVARRKVAPSGEVYVEDKDAEAPAPGGASGTGGGEGPMPEDAVWTPAGSDTGDGR